MTEAEIRRASGAEITAADLYEVLRLRASVFVVEQACAYLDPDGRDLDRDTVHFWVRQGEDITAYLRVIREPDGTPRIGRVVTDPTWRGEGLATQLLDAALEGTSGDVVLDAQSHVTSLYERHGFVVAGDEFLDDGIPHTPMRRLTSG